MPERGSQRCGEMLPLLLLLRHECDKLRVFSQVIQLGVLVKQRIIWKALIGGHSQPFHRLLWFLHKSVSGGDVVRRVMEVSVAAANGQCSLDRLLSFAL